VHLVYALAIVASAVVGLAVGAVLAPGGRGPASAQLAPLVQVVSAPGVTVTVDGRPAHAAPLELSAGKAARVEITRAGKAPAAFDLTLDWNQLRVIDVRALDGAPAQETSP
jgi:hypothetical protein